MKKKNKKFKKNRQIGSSSGPASSQAIAQSNAAAATVLSNEPMAQAPNVEEASPEQALAEKYQYVRRDVKKVLSYIGLVVILLIGFYFLNTKTSLLSEFGNWIYRITNVQAG